MDPNKKHLISIITVAYNAASDIEITKKSLVQQNHDFFEWIIIDGGSSDNTRSIFKQYKYEFKNFSSISESDKGIYDAMNKGIRQASGQYCLFLNAGDSLTNGILEKIFSKIKNEPKLIYGNFFHQGNQQLHWGEFDAYRLCYRTIPHPTAFFHHETIQKTGEYSLEYPIASDYDYFLKAVKNISFEEIEYLNLTISNFQGGGISSFSPDPKFFHDKPLLIKNYLNDKVLEFYYSGIQFLDILQFLDNQKFIVWFDNSQTSLVLDLSNKIKQTNISRKTNNQLILKMALSDSQLTLKKQINRLDTTNLETYWHIIFNPNTNYNKIMTDFGFLENKIVIYKPFIFSHQLLKLLKNHQVGNIIIFGTGNAAKAVIAKIHEHKKLSIDLFFDNNSSKWDQKLNNIKIKKPTLSYVHKDTHILIASQWQLEIRNQLLKMGIPNKQIISTLY